MTPMKWFYSFLKKYWLRMVSGLILVTILAATALASPYISKLIVDDVIKKQNTGLLPKLIILLLAMVVIKGVCRFFSQVLFETSSQGVLYTMRDKVYRKLLLEDFAFYNKNRTGDLMGRQNRRYGCDPSFCGVCDLYGIRKYFVFCVIHRFDLYGQCKACCMHDACAPTDGSYYLYAG